MEFLGNTLGNLSRFISPIPFLRNEISFLFKLYQIQPLKRINDFFSNFKFIKELHTILVSIFLGYFLQNLVTHLAIFSDSWRKSVSKDVTFSTLPEKEQRSWAVLIAV